MNRERPCEFSLAHLTALSLSPPRLVEVAARAGYKYVGLRLNRVTPDEPLYALAEDRVLMAETKARLADSGVAVLDIELARMGPDRDARSYAPILEAGAELGASHVLTQLPDPDRARALERFCALCELARPLGLGIDLEFVSWTETPDLAAAASMLRAAGQPNAGVLVDTLHFARSGSSLEDLGKLPREWFRYAQVCDAPAQAPATKEEVIHAARFARLFPGEGGLPVREILARLPPTIPCALEIPRAFLSKLLGVEEYVKLALRATDNFLNASGDRALTLNVTGTPPGLTIPAPHRS
ncbi:MAG TPA: sugar phosphate isomerase/epimerase [Burkholderiales bacterium]|nr:sugar phosphate isomerase/epimerase [Burkholderiales bacterium]